MRAELAFRSPHWTGLAAANGWAPACRARSRPTSASTTGSRMLRQQTAWRRGSRSSVRRRSISRSRPTRPWRSYAPASAMSRRTDRRGGSAMACSTSPIATAMPNPQPLDAGHFYRVRLRLNDCGYAFAAGHRIRLSLSTAYWPLIWPAPEAATLTLSTEDSRLVLPVRLPRAEDGLVRFEPPIAGPPAPFTRVSPGRAARETRFDWLTGKFDLYERQRRRPLW